MQRESAFTMDTSAIKYGPGVSREVGHDMSQWGVRRVLVVTDPYLAGGSAVASVLEGLRKAVDRIRPALDEVVAGGSWNGEALSTPMTHLESALILERRIHSLIGTKP